MNRLFDEEEFNQRHLRKDVFPTKSDVLLYILPHMGTNKESNTVISETAKMIYEIWESADCCLLTEININLSIKE